MHPSGLRSRLTFVCILLKRFFLRAAVIAALAICAETARAQQMPDVACPRPAQGSEVTEPEDLRSENGVLKVDLTIRNYVEPGGSTRFCYIYGDGMQSPNLRLHPGDLLVLTLKNELTALPTRAASATSASHAHVHGAAASNSDPCTSGVMSATAANLHFHGLTIPSVCHQDEVLKTSIAPGDPPFEYRFRIPANEPPGLYWYHPHIHGFGKLQVLGGASGALIVEGIERANSAVAGLPERVFIIRDQDLLNPNAPPNKSEPVLPPMLLDRDGDTANNGTGFGRPAKDLSINYIPAPYPDYPTAQIHMKPGERQLWRVLNASAITYLNLEVRYKHAAQQVDVVALDGVPVNSFGGARDFVLPQAHLGVPPGGRVEFIVTGPPAGETGLLVTRTVDTGAAGENDPNRAIATILPSADAPEPRATLPAHSQPLPAPDLPWLGSVAPARVRKLYFSEKAQDPNDPNSPTTFFLTVDGETPTPFDPKSDVPSIVVHQGDVEDWIIENRSNELHAFHIHQLHFLLVSWSGTPVNEPFLRDTINVPYFTGRTLQYPNVRLRMDFRDPNTVGTFVYHCHLLEHEDGGMMGLIRVEPKADASHRSQDVAATASKR
jgi:FtsP/CotA-like multicopper oxidase with cupredoxin domain